MGPVAEEGERYEKKKLNTNTCCSPKALYMGGGLPRVGGRGVGEGVVPDQVAAGVEPKLKFPRYHVGEGANTRQAALAAGTQEVPRGSGEDSVLGGLGSGKG